MVDEVFNDDFSTANMQDLLGAKGWQSRYKLLLSWSKMVQLKASIRLRGNLVKGCALDTWLVHEVRGGCHWFAVDSDSRVVKGLAVLLLLQVNGRTAADIQALDIGGLMQELDLQRHLSPSRNNGFKALLDRVLVLLVK